MEEAPTDDEGTKIPPSADWSGLWAVIRLDDRLSNVERLGRLVHAHTHEPVFDVSRRLRSARGILGAELIEAEARSLAEAARSFGVEAAAVPWPVPPLEEERKVIQLAWSEGGIALQTMGEKLFDVPWRRIRVAAGTRMERPDFRWTSEETQRIEWRDLGWRGSSRSTEPLPTLPPRIVTQIDLLIAPAGNTITAPGHLRIEEGSCTFLLDQPTKLAFQKFARALVSRRARFATNPGLERILDRGRWGYLQFRDRMSHRQYLAWLAALARATHRPPGADPTSYLE